MAAHGLPPESLSSLLDFLGAFGLHSTTSALLTELRARGDSLPDVEGLELPFSPLSDGGGSPHAESPMSPGALDAGLGVAAGQDMGTYAGSSPFLAPLQPASPPRPISPQQVPWDEKVNEYDGPDDVGYDRRDVVGQRHFVEVELDLASDAPDAASHSQQQYSQGARTTTSGDFSRADSEDRGSSCGSSISGAVIDLMPTSNSGACALPPGSPAGTSSSKPRALDDLVWDMGPVGIRIAEPVTTPTKSSSVVNADEPKPVLSRVESLSSSFKDFEIERTDDELPSRRTSGGQLNARATSSQAGAELSGGSTSGAAAAAGAAATPTDTIDFQLGPSTCSTQAPQDVEVQFMPSAPSPSAFQLAPPSQPEEVGDPATLPDLMAAAAAAASCAAGAGCSSSAQPASRGSKPADDGGPGGSGGGGGTVTLAAPVFSQPPQPLVLLPPACSEHEGSHSRASPSKADDARENAGGFSFPVTPSVAGAQTDHRIFKSWPSVRSSCTSEVIAASDDDHVAADYADDDYLRSKPSSRSTSQNLGDLNKAFPRGLLHDEEAAGGSGAKASGSGYEGWSFAKGMQPAVSSGGAVADGSREPSLDPPPAADAPQTTSASCISEPSTSAPYLTCMPPGLLQHMAGAASAPPQQPAGSSPATSSATKHHAGLPRPPPGSGASSVTGAPAHGTGLPMPHSSSSHGTPHSPKGPPPPTHLPAGIRLGGGRSSGLHGTVPGADSGAGRASSDSGAGGASSRTGAAAGAAAASDPREPRQSTGAPAIMPALEISRSNTSQVSSHHITPDSPPLSPSAAAKAGTAAVRPGAPTAAATAAASTAATASGDAEVEEQFHEARSGSGQDEETGSASSDDDGTHEDGLVYEPEDDLALEAAAALEWEQLHHQSGSRMSEARSPSSGDVLRMQYSSEGQHLEYDPEYIAHEYDILSLRVYHKRNRTGFEETKDLPIIRGDLIAGQYQVTNFLGSAAFSRAVEARDIKHNHMRVCLKIIKNNKDYFDQSLDEIKLLKYVNSHDPEDKWGIVRLYDYFYYKEHLFLVCELLRANLYDYQKHRRDTHQPNYFTNARIQSIARQVLRSLYFIHTLGLIHSDLKPENILMKSYERCEVKVIDLGSSCYVTDQLSSYVQSRSYRAPEVILGLPYDQKIDIWSLGCILAEMASGQVLFQNDSLATLLARLEGILGPVPEWMLAKGRYANRFYTRRGQLYEKSPQTGRYELLLPKKTSLRHRVPEADEGLLSFIAYLLHVDPHKRPSAAEALQHPWFEVRYPSDGTLFDDTASW